MRKFLAAFGALHGNRLVDNTWGEVFPMAEGGLKLALKLLN